MLPAGTRIGSYEVVAPLGAGGMGEVYRARDARLKRDVAIKVLPGIFAGNPERRVRFQREAEVLAALSHPSIAGIHGLEESDGSPALVLELVEGETLAERIARGPIPLDEALPLAGQVAEALEYAHERGVVHRDLKPLNIKVTPEGAVKVLDFGLARLSDDGAGSAIDITASPTITAVSRAGVLLGTAAYMSPEQVRGKPADRRSDVWAFGCVLYEMLTGERLVQGSEASDILAEVLKGSPDWSRLPANTPAPVRRLLRRCLEKDRARRLPDIGSARLEIADTLAPADDAGPRHAPARHRRVAAAAGAAIAPALAVFALVVWAPWRTAPGAEPMVHHLTVELGAEAALPQTPSGANVVPSPDGRTLAFVAIPHGESESRLFVRRLNQLRAIPLAGTEGAVNPFFSPDGESIGFFARGALRIVGTAGGATVRIAEVPLTPGSAGTWTDRNTIIYAAPPGPLLEVAAAGGAPQPVTTLDDGETAHLWPQALPGGTAVLFTAMAGAAEIAGARLIVQQVPAGERHIVQTGAHHGRYLASGHLAYLRAGTLFAAPFDPARAQLTASGTPIVESVAWSSPGGGAQFAASSTGTLVYTMGSSATLGVALHWVDRSGVMTPLREFPGLWGTPRVSPDGSRIALTIVEADGLPYIWTYDLERGIPLKVTQEPAAVPVWAADGRRIVFGSERDGGVYNLYWQRADGTGEAVRLTRSEHPQLPGSWHPTRPLLAFHEGLPDAGQRIMLLDFDGDEASGWRPGEPTVLIGGSGRHVMPVFSPEGDWIAYVSNKTERFELYVRPFPDRPDVEERKLSDGGGNDPMWTRQEIFFTTLVGAQAGQIMAVPYTVDRGLFRPGIPRALNNTLIARPPFATLGQYADLDPDGERFAVAGPAGAGPGAGAAADEGSETVVLVLNFFEELRRRSGR